jgi:purine-binding chemotaxis protein CheW
MRDQERKRLLVVEAAGLTAAIPLESAREIMRPLPIAVVAGSPPFVLGLSVIRGASVPVVDLGALLGRPAGREELGRFATLVVEGRSVAVAVRAVSGIVDLDPETLSGLPPLLSHAANDVVDALALHDTGLLLVLKATRLVLEIPTTPAEESA